ncbi:Protein CBG16039 [Caenorhabditis briggsae]|uniref:Protein CBG16039 n=1 Tax=Caenorhabditis briggsae TaxID=6238 RepID=A8XN84_CAEBR|nr:Protein CBG16039 [Caenorhabditis briggsae]CAP34315.1 Protein CBG16039 [Caenorhabditis briggsae]
MASNEEDPIVKLNVGGVMFQTLKSTLTKHKSMFKVMLETEMPVTKDESGCIFIDRDPKKFEKVLEFLRTGRIDFSGPGDILSVQEEAHHFMLESLEEYCSIVQHEKIQNSARDLKISESVKIIENDSELLKIIKKIGKPILVFHVPVTNFGSIQLPVGFDFPIFKKFYAPRLNIYLKPYSTQSSVRHQEWQWTLYKKDYSEGNSPRDPRQMFRRHLEASIDGFLMD